MTAHRKHCHINRPNKQSPTGFVFICPGRHEEQESKPCARQTGQGLEDGLAHLHRLRPDWFKSSSRYDYLITNAWDQIEYKARTGRSVPTAVEVATRRNVERLYSEIRHLKRVVACGELAHLAVRLCVEFLGYGGSVAYVSHTSRQALGCPTAATYGDAIESWAQDVVGNLRRRGSPRKA